MKLERSIRKTCDAQRPVRAWPAAGLAFACALVAILTSVLASAPAFAQYKVVAPDGSVTYTDRQPPSDAPRVAPLTTAAANPANALTGLPQDLRQIATRFPVVLYTTDACEPCNAARQFLQQRGVPYTERQVSSAEDTAALERLVGGRSVPSLTIGRQPLLGFMQADWTGWLDAAGYPKDSRLPPGWRAPAPAPLVARAATPPAAAPAPASPPVAAPAPAATPPLPPASGIRF